MVLFIRLQFHLERLRVVQLRQLLLRQAGLGDLDDARRIPLGGLTQLAGVVQAMCLVGLEAQYGDIGRLTSSFRDQEDGIDRPYRRSVAVGQTHPARSSCAPVCSRTGFDGTLSGFLKADQRTQDRQSIHRCRRRVRKLKLQVSASAKNRMDKAHGVR